MLYLAYQKARSKRCKQWVNALAKLQQAYEIKDPTAQDWISFQARLNYINPELKMTRLKQDTSSFERFISPKFKMRADKTNSLPDGFT